MKPLPSGAGSRRGVRRTTRKRTTRQLEQVFKALQGDPTHPYADEIHRRVRKELPRISLATVYRNLHRLVEDGKIRTVLVDNRVVRYDPETSDHDHFICEGCGRVIDLFLGRARRMELAPLANDGYIVRTHNVMVYGRCQVCAARRETSKSPRPTPRASSSRTGDGSDPRMIHHTKREG